MKENQWVNSINENVIGEPYDTKEKAVIAGRALAQKIEVDHIIKNADGSTERRASYH